MPNKILAIMIGGTIAQKGDASGRMAISVSLNELLSSVRTESEIEQVELDRRSGADLDFPILASIAGRIRKSVDEFDGFMVIAGTDSMEELAFYLDQTIETEKPIVVTGSLKPADVSSYDGFANLEDAIRVLQTPASSGKGVLVVMNENIHAARYVRKQDSQLLGSFVSHPGPIGQIRRGIARYYFDAMPKMHRYGNIDLDRINARVPLITMCIGLTIPDALLENVDGLVVAGMGTGSISKEMVEHLSPSWTSRIPIVLSSRCPIGENFDDSPYRGSLSKYEDRGFVIRGYEGLNPLQARLKLLFEIASR